MFPQKNTEAFVHLRVLYLESFKDIAKQECKYMFMYMKTLKAGDANES